MRIRKNTRNPRLPGRNLSQPISSSGGIRKGLAILCVCSILLTACGPESERQAAAPEEGNISTGELLFRARGLGTVGTLVGPVFCGGTATFQPESITPLSLAVNPTGRVFFDISASGAGLIARVEADGGSTTIPSLQVKPASIKGAQKVPGPPRGASLAPDGQGGVFVGGENRVLHLGGGSQTLAAGQPSTDARKPAAAPSASPEPVSKALFNKIGSIAVDEVADLYIAEQDPSEPTNFQIRFLNRSANPRTFYDGTAAGVTVPPQHIGTLVGVSPLGGPKPPSHWVGTGIPGLPTGLAVRGSLLYVASYESGGKRPGSKLRIINIGSSPQPAHGRIVSPGIVANLTTNGVPENGGTGGVPAKAFSLVSGIDADGKGNLYLSDEVRHRISKLDSAGRLATVAGLETPNPSGGFNGNDRPATEARLNRPRDVKVGTDGRVFFSDMLNGQVRVVDPAGIIRAAPGNGVGAAWRCAEKGTSDAKAPTAEQQLPQSGRPTDMAADSKGNFYVALVEGHQIKKVDKNGVARTAVGQPSRNAACGPKLGCPDFGGDGKSAKTALLNRPSALALTRDGNLYILDSGNNRVRFVNLGRKGLKANGVTVAPGEIGTVAGNGQAGSAGEGGKAIKSPLGPYAADPLAAIRGLPRAGVPSAFVRGADLGALTPDRAGNLYVVDPQNRRVHKIDAAGRITTFAGEGGPPERSDCCLSPTTVAVDVKGNLYVGDRNTFRVWFINTGSTPVVYRGQQAKPGQAIPVAGTGKSGFAGDRGPALQADLFPPTGLAVDVVGNLYIAEYGEIGFAESSGSVRKVDTVGVITTVSGTGQTAFNGDGLRARLTNLDHPTALDFDDCGNLLIADSGMDRIRRVILSERCSP